MLTERGHYTTPADDPQKVEQQIAALLVAWEGSDFASAFHVRQPVMLEEAVCTLLGLIPGCQQVMSAVAAEAPQPTAATVIDPLPQHQPEARRSLQGRR